VLPFLSADDPNFRTQRPRHREFILGRSKLLEVVPFRNTPELLNLVVFTYRLEYIRECILFPYLNDNGFGSSGCVEMQTYRSSAIITRKYSIMSSARSERISSILYMICFVFRICLPLNFSDSFSALQEFIM
jgi:hypothetical protein